MLTAGDMQSYIVTINKPTYKFYRPDALPVAQPIASQHWREILSFSSRRY